MGVQLSSYDKAGFRDRVRGDLGLRSQNYVTDGDIDGWGHEAQRLVAWYTHWLRSASSQNVVSGTATYDLPTDAISIDEVWVNSKRMVLTKVQRLEWQHWNIDWRAIEGTPTHYYLEGMTRIGLYPKPNANITNGLVLRFTYFPAAPAEDDDFYTVPTVLDYALVTYAKMRASEKDATGEGRERLALYRGEWREVLGQLKELVGDVAEGELLILGGEQDDDFDDAGWREQLWGNPISIP